MGLFSWLFDRFLRRSRDIPGAGPGDKAFLVGINNYPSSPLRGCVNDVHSFKALLLQKYGFKEANVRILLDSNATTKNMTDGLYWLASGAVPGDKRFHHFSGHGTQYPNASEDDGLSEVVCLAGDTKIPLLDGRELTIKELASLGKGVWVYSIDKNGDVRPGRVTKAWMTSSNAPLLKVTLDNGKSVRCTPDHLWMMRDGSYKKAIELTPKDSLMPHGIVNHKVASVEPDGFGEVFDINVPEFENFAVSSGVFLHNCPVDFDWSPDKMISDKAYYSIFSSMPKGVVLNWVSDSCHSGDLQRSLSRASFRSRSRFMKPTHEILALLASRRKRIKLARSVTGSFLDVGFVSACRSDQTASDTNIGGTPCGALSWFMVKELSQAASDVPLDKLVESVRRQMLLAAYDQVPQVEGSRSIRPFLMP